MPITTKKFSPLAPDLTRRYFDSLRPEPPAIATTIEIEVGDLRLDDQPRQIVPDEVLAQLIAADLATPAALLAALEEQTHPYYAHVRARLGELATSIATNGVLTPLLVALHDDRYVIRDGHRRSLAALIAGRTSVPAQVIDEPTDVDAAARQLVVNVQREDLTALEKARWMLRLAQLVEESFRQELKLGDGSVVNILIREIADSPEDDSEQTWRTLSTAEKDLARRIQERVCELTGLRRRQYYNLMALNRLSPEARTSGLMLTEAQLRPVTALAPEDQAVVTEFVARHALGRREATSLVQVVKSGDRDAVQRVMARLAREDQGRKRSSVSWEPLLYALPQDIDSRCNALHAELRALPDDLRRVRLRAMNEQVARARELLRQFDELLNLFDYSSEPDPSGALSPDSPN